jgi:hypothetical protein
MMEQITASDLSGDGEINLWMHRPGGVGPKKISFDDVVGLIDTTLITPKVVKGLAHFLSRLGTI